MIAKISIAKNRRRPICNRGIIAFMIDFRTTCKPRGDTERRPKAGEQAHPKPCLQDPPQRTHGKGR
jgi:hypothetical protein